MFYSPFENTSNELSKMKQSFAEEQLFFSEDVTCPKCKTQLADFLETGYLGCAECYSLFEKDVKNMIYDFHKAYHHVGKKPDKISNKARINKEINELLKKQAEASANEDYILAQSIKEKIIELRRNL